MCVKLLGSDGGGMSVMMMVSGEFLIWKKKGDLGWWYNIKWGNYLKT